MESRKRQHVYVSYYSAMTNNRYLSIPRVLKPVEAIARIKIGAYTALWVLYTFSNLMTDLCVLRLRLGCVGRTKRFSAR